MRVLFNWYYHRADLTKYILELGAGHDLYFIDRFFLDGVDIPGAKVIYWSDYSSPYTLLNHVRPDKVVFSDIEAFPQLALNIAARNRGIPTLVLQHGSRGAFEVGDAPPPEHPVSLSNTTARTACFFLLALRPRNWKSLPRLARFAYERKRFELTAALRRNPFELRRADLYVELSPENAGYHRMRDGVPDDRFLLIGHPSLDTFFQEVRAYTAKDYAVLIDAPFLEASGAGGKMHAAEKVTYIQQLASFCAAQNLRLLVKLHPLSYNADLPTTRNVTYVRETDFARLIGECQFVVAVHYSSLTAPAFHAKPFYAFHNRMFGEIPFLRKTGAPVHDLHRFDEAALGPPSPPLSWDVVEPYLGSNDGQSMQRLGKILFEL